MAEAKDKKIEVKKEEHTSEKPETVEKKEEKPEAKKDTEIQKRRPTYRPLARFFEDLWKPFRLFDYEPFSLSVFDEDPFFRTPLANITEDEKAYHLQAELPGLDKGDLEVTIHDGMLEIKGEKKEEHEEKGEEGYVRREYSSSSYYRNFELPENVDEDLIDATLEKGVLKLKMPKRELEEKEKKKIEVK